MKKMLICSISIKGMYLFVFSETFQWFQPKVTGDIPEGRGQHSAAVVGDKLVLFGGSSQFNPEMMGCNKFYGDTYVLSTGMQNRREKFKHCQVY